MSDNIYCRKLKFDFQIDTKDLDYLKSTVDTSKIKDFTLFKPKSPAPQYFKDFLRSIDIKINFYEIFYTAPGAKMTIHDDGKELITKINWIFGANGSSMNWWKAKDKNCTPVFYRSSIGTECEVYEYDKCECVYTEKLHSPSLVNVKQLHSIDNPTNEGRWCMSFALYDLEKDQYLTWEDAVAKLSKFVV